MSKTPIPKKIKKKASASSTQTGNLINISPQSNLQRYLQEIQHFPILTKQEEVTLARNWSEKGDTQAAHKLVTSHLRLVARIAMGYKGYGLPIAELIAEGNIGMMQAVRRFDPERGFRLATYAMWWIRATMQEYILRSWSLVKIGTTAAQKKLFFNLRRIKGKLQAFKEGDMTPDQVKTISSELNVPETEVVNMNRRLAASDHSLNAPIAIDGQGEWQDWLKDEHPGQEQAYAAKEELSQRRTMLEQAMDGLSEREQQIFHARRLKDPIQTLEELSHVHHISRERVRQIEARSFEKIQKSMRNMAIHQKLQ